ncbi:hypothetical protein [Pseudopelagicola sp. nBUS_19]|uniref:hypothetical protein n=1 Tax=Pseudopelagicola sp. nBUS_19 TaxID=3395316 RepID=UPI003EBB6EDD
MTSRDANKKAQLIVQDILTLPRSSVRKLIAIAGPPAAGKSTIAAQVKQLLEFKGYPTGFVPMDGFHLGNKELKNRKLMAFKGAPETFDHEGLAATVRRLKLGLTVTIPLFDRKSDRTMPEAATVTEEEKYVVIEGNYLLFDEPEWKGLAAYWDYSVFIEEHVEELTKRLHKRWIDNGFEVAEVLKRTEENDLPNALRVLEKRLPSHRTI